MMFYQVLTIQDPYPQSLWKTATSRIFWLIYLFTLYSSPSHSHNDHHEWNYK